MNSEFPRILTLLRKERGISQKKAASELSISQALLSHYEKGIRECGLDFVVKAADYYNVSCDFLLGRSPERTGKTLSVEDIPEADLSVDNKLQGSILPTLNKKLIFNSLNILFDFLQKINCKELTTKISDFLMIAVYRMFRTIFSLNSKNEQGLFMISKHLYTAKSLATMAEIEADVNLLASGKGNKKLISQETRESVNVTTENLSQEYPGQASSILNLIQNSENKIK